MRISILLIASAVSLSAASTATAGEVVITSTPGPSTTVTLADLDLTSSTGIATGKSRIAAAAADLCLTNAVEPVDMRMARSKCYRAAVADGHRQLDRMANNSAASINAATVILTNMGR